MYVCVCEGDRDRETLCDETVTHRETKSVQYPGKPGQEPGFEVAVGLGDSFHWSHQPQTKESDVRWVSPPLPTAWKIGPES